MIRRHVSWPRVARASLSSLAPTRPMQDATHFRTLFRVLRPDELGPTIKPKTDLRDQRPIRDKVLDHVTDGSSRNYKSSLISCTSELNVALAFGGILSRIAVIDPRAIPVKNIVYLDKEYLRQQCFTQQHALSRSRRSDEVVVDCHMHTDQYKYLEMEIRHCERQLCPGFEENDTHFFPTPEMLQELGMKTVAPLGGANKRLFRVKVGDHTFIARPPRPNVCLERPILFGDNLLTQCSHEFASFSAYRHLTSPSLVPRCALYTFNLEYDEVPSLAPRGCFEWGLILMEDLEELPELTAPTQNAIKEAATRLFGADLLFGNWGCVDGTSISELAKDIIYAKRVSDGAVVRVAVDRALGCTYPEDFSKPCKVPVKFGDNTTDIKVHLLQRNRWLYGHLDERRVAQNVMDLHLDQVENFENIEACVNLAQWPCFASSSEVSIVDVVRCRKDDLLETLPYHFLPTVLSQRPKARDGHAAVCFPEEGFMVIMGGNTSNGPVKDVWKLELASGKWQRMKDIPGEPRFSFSAHPWKTKDDSHFILIFGGGNVKGRTMLGELLLFHVGENKWYPLQFPTRRSIPPRCRHASTWRISGDGAATMHIIGGHDEAKKRSDTFEIILKHEPGCLPKIMSCERMCKLPSPTHRAFTFQLPEDDDRIFMIGGLGSKLRKIQVVSGTGPKDGILTHGSLDVQLPKTLSGFAAVFDETDQRIVLLGGGQNAAQQNRRIHKKSLGRSMGRASAWEQPFRVLYLTRTVDSEQREEWKWDADENHERLDTLYRLPVRTSWSACLVNHNIILFGGRHGNKYSNETITVQLRPHYVAAMAEIDESAKGLRFALDDILREWGPPAKKDALKVIQAHLPDE